MIVSDKGIELIKKFEGLSLKPYLCPARIPTIGYGNTFYEDGTKVTMSDKLITAERATAMLKVVVSQFAVGVAKLITFKGVSQHQFDALVSFAYNVGLGNLKSSTLLKRVNKNEMELASMEFKKWDKAGGKVLAGLTKRREAEAMLFREP
jgi:lysozyme